MQYKKVYLGNKKIHFIAIKHLFLANLDFDAKVKNGTCDFTVKIPLVESPYAYGMGDDTRAISLKLTHLTVNLCEE